MVLSFSSANCHTKDCLAVVTVNPIVVKNVRRSRVVFNIMPGGSPGVVPSKNYFHLKVWSERGILLNEGEPCHKPFLYLQRKSTACASRIRRSLSIRQQTRSANKRHLPFCYKVLSLGRFCGLASAPGLIFNISMNKLWKSQNYNQFLFHI